MPFGILFFVEEEITQHAKRYARKNKDVFIETFIKEGIHLPTDQPVTFFMAGSPGAGKTEFSKSLVDLFGSPPVRIDADEIRSMFPGYHGDNAHLFQYPASIIVDDLYKHCLKHEYNAIVDGTFAYKNALQNIQLSLGVGRVTEIYFVYQEPALAWNFTQKRELLERRMIRKEDFITTFYKAFEHVEAAKSVFGDRLALHLIVKNNNNEPEKFKLNIPSLHGYISLPSRPEIERMIA